MYNNCEGILPIIMSRPTLRRLELCCAWYHWNDLARILRHFWFLEQELLTQMCPLQNRGATARPPSLASVCWKHSLCVWRNSTSWDLHNVVLIYPSHCRLDGFRHQHQRKITTGAPINGGNGKAPAFLRQGFVRGSQHDQDNQQRFHR